MKIYLIKISMRIYALYLLKYVQFFSKIPHLILDEHLRHIHSISPASKDFLQNILPIFVKNSCFQSKLRRCKKDGESFKENLQTISSIHNLQYYLKANLQNNSNLQPISRQSRANLEPISWLSSMLPEANLQTISSVLTTYLQTISMIFSLPK